MSNYAKEAINWANPDNDGRGALHEACFHQHLGAVQLLIDALGVDIDMLDSRGRSPLHHKTSDKIKAALDRASHKASSVDGKEFFEAAHSADMPALQNLIVKMQGNEGSVVNWQNPEHDLFTPLHIACFECLPEVVKALLGVRGIDARILDEFGKTALEVARTNPAGEELDAVVAAFEAFQRRGGEVDVGLGAGDGGAAKLQDSIKVEDRDSERPLGDVEAAFAEAVAALMTAQEVVSFVQTHAKGLASTEKGALALLKKIEGIAGDEAGRDAFAAAGTTSEFWAWVVRALPEHVKSAAVSEWGCRAVANLSDCHPANKAKLGEAGGCEAVVAALREHVKSAAVSEWGCRAARHLGPRV